jgi:hypothetical protein
MNILLIQKYRISECWTENEPAIKEVNKGKWYIPWVY